MATTPYLTVEEFTERAAIPRSYVEDLEAAEPGWVLLQLQMNSAMINTRLGKRYAVPFQVPYPEILGLWLCDLVSYAVLIRRGVNSNDTQSVDMATAAQRARDDLKEAADSKEGLFELPLNASQQSAVTRKQPRVYSEQSPYTSARVQARLGRLERSNVR